MHVCRVSMPLDSQRIRDVVDAAPPDAVAVAMNRVVLRGRGCGKGWRWGESLGSRSRIRLRHKGQYQGSGWKDGSGSAVW